MAKRRSKAQAVRDFLAANRTASNTQVVEALSQKRIAVTTQQVAQIKYDAKKRSETKNQNRGGVKKGHKPKRSKRPYPASSFKEAMVLGEAIQKYAAGEKVRRLTLLEKMQRAPESSSTKMLITNSNKYKITQGSYAAEYIDITPHGRTATDPSATPTEKLTAQFSLAIAGIPSFKYLYDEYVGKKLPAQEVMHDVLHASNLQIPDVNECVDLFIVNAKDLGLLRAIGGAEMLIPIEQALEEYESRSGAHPVVVDSEKAIVLPAKTNWNTLCFYIAPIGDEESDVRKHSDLFLEHIVTPAMRDVDLRVVRADQIAEPGMITSHILEHIKRAKLVVADLSLLNPNVFYEIALRHVAKLPIVQIVQKADRLPFDIKDVNTIIIDNTDIYSLIPHLETYRSEIATLARRALEDPEHIGNPISAFFPEFWQEGS
jgi:hypothetical protein